MKRLKPTTPRRAFTLIELLVTLGAIALLLGILLPVLAGARDRAVETSELSLTQQSGLALTAYTSDHRGDFPYYGIRGTDRAPLRYHDGPREGEFVDGEFGAHWRHVRHWAYYVIGLGYDARSAIVLSTNREANNPPGTYPPRAWDVMSATAVASPPFFGDPTGDASDYGPQKTHLVTHPSRKGMLRRENWSALLSLEDGAYGGKSEQVPVFVWFPDGHSSMHAPADMFGGVAVDGLYQYQGAVHTTREGIHGRDR